MFILAGFEDGTWGPSGSRPKYTLREFNHLCQALSLSCEEPPRGFDMWPSRPHCLYFSVPLGASEACNFQVGSCHDWLSQTCWGTASVLGVLVFSLQMLPHMILMEHRGQNHWIEALLAFAGKKVDGSWQRWMPGVPSINTEVPVILSEFQAHSVYLF